MKILVTGGAGFIGSNFVHYILSKYSNKILILDNLTYAGNLDNLSDIIHNIIFIKGDICDRKAVAEAMAGCGTVINFAAETHVDRSITDAGVFVKTDVLGTYTLLEEAKKRGVKKFIQISTDEVYGSTEKGSFTEESPLAPNSPYSASKASSDMLCRSYCITYGFPVIITRSSNNFGPFQHPEKFMPTVILNAMQDKKIPVYGDGRNVRDWIYVADNCEAIDAVMQKGVPGEIYNIGGGNEKKNIDTCRMILKELGRGEELINFVKDRPGHDRRYSIDSEKVRKLGWAPRTSFREGLAKTVKWYADNKRWWSKILTKIQGARC